MSAAKASAPAAAKAEKSDWLLLRSAVTTVLVLTTGVSVWLIKGSMYGGKSAAHVWWYGWVTALSTGLGALPMAFVKSADRYFLGISNALAGGMMTAASACLIMEGLELGGVEGAPFTPVQCVALGGAIGIAFIIVSQYLLSGVDDVHVGILEGIDVRRVRCTRARSTRRPPNPAPAPRRRRRCRRGPCPCALTARCGSRWVRRPQRTRRRC